MSSPLVQAVRSRLSVRPILLWAVSLAFVVAVTEDLVVVLAIAAGFAGSEALDVLVDVPGIDERWAKAALGLVVTVAGGVWLWVELSGATSVETVFPALALATGLWLTLDARADFVQGRRVTEPDTDEMEAGEAMLAMQHIRLVATEIQTGPKTVSELATACDLTESRVRTAIDLASEDGTVYPVETDADDPRYALDEQKIGATGVGQLLGGGLWTLVSRLARPLVDQF
ncbi:hypothetical protein [Halovenus salina]|uniref:Uncharacterized protein n=1 Tax=Halovenus salina TaxID=1510225 RepID=A0ABD5W2B7_9EURY|nr:hypothetical protein [Halovenus salina]